MIRTSNQIFLGDKIKNNEVGGHVTRLGRGELHTGFWWGSLMEGDYLET
jgi:hypothetical protein